MRRFITAGCAMLLASSTAGATAHQAFAAKMLCVGGDSGCYSTLQAAVDAAHDGDAILVEQGTFTGGVSIDVSVRIVGDGSDRTILKGGDSVLTIGRYGATSEPTVSIVGLTITGGVARSSPESVPFFGVAGVLALGGGLEIPPSKNFGVGAKVSIDDSVISGNRVAPTRVLPPGPTCPPNVNCPFAGAAGGGIDNWGNLTLRRTTVSHNLVGAASGLSSNTSDAEGGGIMSAGGLVLNDSVVSDNHVSATGPNGRFADAGGVFAQGATLTMNDDMVTNNSAVLSAALPNSVQTLVSLAIAGGVHLSGSTSGTIRDTTVSDNSLSATNSVGDAVAFSGGLHADGPLVLSDDTMSGNSVSATTPPKSSGSASADSGVGEINGPSVIRDSRFIGNSVRVTSPSGTASAQGGGLSTAGNPRTTIKDSVIRDNRLSATTTTGSAIVQGSGIWNIGLLTLRDTTVAMNTAIAHGPSGMAQGGGIWNSTIPGGPPSVQLTLIDTRVTGNELIASPAITSHGGGVYSTLPLTQSDSIIDENVPDQCYGC